MGGAGGGYPLHRRVQVQDASIFHLWRTLHLSAVEVVAGEAHDVIVHAVLNLQQGDGLRVVFYDALHQCLAQSCFESGDAFDGRRQLAVVTGQDYPRHSSYGYPAGGFQGLCRLVNEQCAELLTVQQAVGRTYQGRGNDTGLAEQFVVDAYLQCRSATLQTLQLLVVLLIASLAVAAHVVDGLADGPQMWIVGMALETALIRE